MKIRGARHGHIIVFLIIVLLTCASADVFCMSAGESDERNGCTADTLNGSGFVMPFAVKTNLLFDLATIVNAEIEIPFRNRWSLDIEYCFPWWRLKEKNYTVQLISAGVEGRYWFGSKQSRALRDVLTGWFAGLYVGGGYYDFQLGKDNGIQGEFYITSGISAGYAHSISRSLRLEYSIGVGYLQSDYRPYTYVKGTQYGDIKVREYPWEVLRQSWIGPTKAKVSLIWIIDFKGGEEIENEAENQIYTDCTDRYRYEFVSERASLLRFQRYCRNKNRSELEQVATFSQRSHNCRFQRGRHALQNI